MPQLESSRRGSAPGAGPHGAGRPRPQVLPPCTQAPPQRLHRAGLGSPTASWGSRESHPDTGGSLSPSWVLWVWMVCVCMGTHQAHGTQRTPPSSPAGAKPGVPSPALSPRRRVSRSLRAESPICWARNPMAGDRQVSSAWKGRACGPAHGSPKQREPHAQLRPRVTACLCLLRLRSPVQEPLPSHGGGGGAATPGGQGPSRCWGRGLGLRVQPAAQQSGGPSAWPPGGGLRTGHDHGLQYWGECGAHGGDAGLPRAQAGAREAGTPTQTFPSLCRSTWNLL